MCRTKTDTPPQQCCESPTNGRLHVERPASIIDSTTYTIPLGTVVDSLSTRTLFLFPYSTQQIDQDDIDLGNVPNTVIVRVTEPNGSPAEGSGTHLLSLPRRPEISLGEPKVEPNALQIRGYLKGRVRIDIAGVTWAVRSRVIPSSSEYGGLIIHAGADAQEEHFRGICISPSCISQ